MSNKAEYTQCRLERQLPSGAKQIHVAYIPSHFAKIGKKVELMMDSDDEGSWSADWVVMSKGGTMNSVQLENHRSAQKNFASKLK